MPSIIHDRVSLRLRESLTGLEPGADPTIFGIWGVGEATTMTELGSLTKLLLEAERSGYPIGEALGLISVFAREETLDDLGIADPEHLFAIALRVETWAVGASGNEVSLDLANLLTSERRLSEHPDAFTSYACWAHCIDGTGHEAVWREHEPAPRHRLIGPGDRRWRTDQIPTGLQSLLHTLIDLRRRRPAAG